MHEFVSDSYRSEVSPLILPPTREVVAIAMQKLRSGYFRRGQQKTALLYSEGMRIYELASLPVVMNNRGEIYPSGSLCYGLFISGIQLDKGGYQAGRLRDIELPRDPSEVRLKTLFKLSDIDPKAMYVLADELQKARRFDDKVLPRR